MKQLAEVMDIHPSSVGRFFKKNTGYTTTEYLNQIRIGYACRLLMGKNISISNASFASGFNNLSHFNRLFLKIKRMTPKII